jgi:hypothetical protein
VGMGSLGRGMGLLDMMLLLIDGDYSLLLRNLIQD